MTILPSSDLESRDHDRNRPALKQKESDFRLGHTDGNRQEYTVQRTFRRALLCP